jgi:L-alanine-DL-glutamate epimerase-like enolase superfamily enzyme
MRRVAFMGQARSPPTIPLCWTTDIAVGAALHFFAAQPDSAHQVPNVMDNSLPTTRLLTEPLGPHNVPEYVHEGPGLGIDIHEKTFEAYRWTPPA